MLAPDPVWPLSTPPDALAVACRHIVDDGAWAAQVERYISPDEDEWHVTCSDDIHHDIDPWDEEDDPSSRMTTTHLAHLVRAVPSLATLADLPDAGEAYRLDPGRVLVRHRPGGLAGQTGLNSPPPCHSAQETFQSP